MTLGCWIETKDLKIHLSEKERKINENVKWCCQTKQLLNDAEMKASLISKTITLDSCSAKTWRNWKTVKVKEARNLNKRSHFDWKAWKEIKRSTKICKIGRWKCQGKKKIAPRKDLNCKWSSKRRTFETDERKRNPKTLLG